MKELLRTNDLVLISAIEAMLKSEDIPFMLADQFMSAAEGSIGFLPRRLMIHEDDLLRARHMLREAEMGDVLDQK